jgi:predicted dehydrogenase
MIRIGVIGYGYWGPNIVRNFTAHHELTVTHICDTSPDRLKAAKESYPGIKVTSDPSEILNDPSIDAIANITPVYSHYEIAKQALLNGKHVFIEKPFTSNLKQASELVELAEKKRLLIMVDHTFLFTGSVMKMKELVKEGTLGNLYYYDSVRVNLGLFQHDINVIWDLAPHDLSIMNYIVPNLRPISVNANGAGHIGSQLEDVAYLFVKYENNFIAHFHSNWLSPVKIRRTLVAGDKKMLVWDDLEQDNKLKVFDKGVEVREKEDIYKLLVQYRSGEMYTPRVENTEALKIETEYFVDCIKSGNLHPINDGIAGMEVVKILEASDRSIKSGGKEIKVS